MTANLSAARVIFTRVSPFVCVVCLLMGAIPLSGQRGAANGEWRHYGGDAGTTKYSPLDQIHKGNVGDLRIAWRWKTENFGPRPDPNYETTPLMVGGVLYTLAGSRRAVVAIDGATGETHWMFRHDEGVRGQRAPRPNYRGLSYWSDGRNARVLYITPGYQLIALDAATGRPAAGFGKEGIVDLYDDFDQPRPADGVIGSSSPPLIVNDVVVVGAAMQSGGAPRTRTNTVGHVRGYDVRSGKRLWIFHTVPRAGEFGNETWEADSWSYTGNAAVWAPMSADEELGYLYLPVETATGDFYGGHRPGNNLFSDSLVCLDAKTGKRVWHFQLTHHDVWDYDLPTAPTLMDITVGGRKIKAVAQITKQAWVYVFDRVTGQPVWPIEERAVAQSDVPGEKTSPTQPFPTKPAPFDRQGISVDDLIDLTPELKAEAVKIASAYKLGPIYTPPIVVEPNGLRGILETYAGNWQGGAVDAETGILYVASITDHLSVGLRKADPKVSEFSYVTGGGGEGGPPAPRGPGPRTGCGKNGPQGLPLFKPPWGRITAIDMNTGDHLWMVPNGTTPECVTNHPALQGMKVPNTGRLERPGIMVTKTLMFAGEGGGVRNPSGPLAGGPMFRAYDKQSGAIVWEFRLPGNQTGIPMTYQVAGKQFIVVPIGAPGQAGELVALSLP